MIRRIRRESRGGAGLGVVALGCAGLLMAVLVEVALADDPPRTVGGVAYVHDVTEVTPPGQFTIDVRCPGGTHVSGGASYSESGSQGKMQAGAPADGADADHQPDDFWRARHSFSGTEGVQGFNAFVICLGGGVTYVSRSAVLHPGESKRLTASCGTARHVAGGGAALLGSGSAEHINSTYPSDNRDAGAEPDDGWTARAFNGTGGDRRLRVTATCVTAMPTYVFAMQAVSPGSTNYANSGCPATRHVIGVGARVSGRAKDAVIPTVAIGDGADADFAPDDTAQAGARVSSSAPGSSTVTAWAVCRG